MQTCIVLIRVSFVHAQVFTEKGLLNISEEGQLVAAAQDWLHVEAQRDALAGVLKRNPTHEELSAALDMPSK